MTYQNQRQQKDTRTIWYPEAANAPGADPAIPVGIVVPLAGENGVADTQDPSRMPIGMGDGLSDSLVAGLIRYGGSMPIGIDFDFFGYALASIYSGYAHVGATLLHEFFEDVATAGARPSTFQLQDELLEPPPQFTRGRYNRLSEIACNAAESGGAQATLQVMGVGDIVDTDLGGTKTNYGFEAASYFDTAIKYTVGGVTHVLSGTSAANAFSTRVFRATDVPPAFGNAGVGAHVSCGVLSAEAQIGIPVNVGGTGPSANLSMYSDAKNRRVVGIEFILANGPFATCTAYWRRQIVAGFVFRQRPKPAPGTSGLTYNARVEVSRMRPALMRVCAEYHATIKGPYAIDGTCDKLGIKVDGGATQVITLTHGATRSAEDLMTDVNATLNGATADEFLGWPRLTSNTYGTASSIQIDTTIANSAHEVLGFDGTARGGRDNCQVRDFLYSAAHAAAYRV